MSMIISRAVKVTIERRELLQLFVRAITPEARLSTGKDFVFWQALGHLVGISDVQAVRIANKKAQIHDIDERIAVDEFRKWLPKAFSKFAGDIMNKRENE